MAPVSPYHREGCARLGKGRLKAFRLNVYEHWQAGYINSQPVPLRIDGATISHALNEQADTASFRTRGVVPVAGQSIAVYEGEASVTKQLFGGRIIETTAIYEKQPKNVAYDLRCIDPTWLLNRRKVLAYYVNQSATAIVLDIVARFCRGVTTRAVAAGLPIVDAITFTNESPAECFTAICQRIGAYWYPDYANDLHVFVTEATTATAITDAQPHGSAEHQITEDLSQVVTRVVGRGGGVGVAVEASPGATELPVEEGTDQPWYSPSGGLAEVGPQVLTYSGIRGRGGAGAFVGTGNAPSAAVAPEPYAGSSHTFGATYQYAATFTTAAGETLPGPIGSILIQNLVMNPPTTPTARSRGAGSYPPGLITPGATQIRYCFQVWYANGARGPAGPVSATYTWDGYDWETHIGASAPVAGGGVWFPEIEPTGFVAAVSAVAVYRSDNGGAWFLCAYLPGLYAGSAPNWWGGLAQSYSSSPAGIYPTSGVGSVRVNNLPVSTKTDITGRKIYRTVANGAALKLLATIANKTDTAYVDTIADGALGAAPPAADTSGVKDEGQVLPGATEFPVSSTVPFSADVGPGGGGGWVRVGSLPVRYTGIGTGVLTGVPATGVGSITATVRYGTQVIIQPRLVGIPAAGTGAIVYAIKRGDTAIVRLEKQDDAAATAMAVRFNSAVLADGIIEETISDSRFGLAELADQIDAMLTERKDPHRTVVFTTRDESCEVGRLITIDISTPSIHGTYRIQRVTFSEIAITGGRAMVAPLRRVEATNKLFTFTDLLRQLRGREGGVP